MSRWEGEIKKEEKRTNHCMDIASLIRSRFTFGLGDTVYQILGTSHLLNNVVKLRYWKLRLRARRRSCLGSARLFMTTRTLNAPLNDIFWTLFRHHRFARRRTRYRHRRVRSIASLKLRSRALRENPDHADKRKKPTGKAGWQNDFSLLNADDQRVIESKGSFRHWVREFVCRIYDLYRDAHRIQSYSPSLSPKVEGHKSVNRARQAKDRITIGTMLPLTFFSSLSLSSPPPRRY
jgi:hypothetical protein